jgi:predicted nucleotidyltransferase
MSLPDFDETGDMPAGVYQATFAEVVKRFGGGTVERRSVTDRLRRIYECVVSTGYLARFVVFGSYVTRKSSPNDVDILLIMEDEFDVEQVTGEVALVFQHMEADSHFGASVFWTTRRGAFGGEQAMIDYWQTCRGGGKRGIVEIVPEKS